jgi:hypothetical protein
MIAEKREADTGAPDMGNTPSEQNDA